MTGKTHEAGGVLVSVVGMSILANNGLLLDDIPVALQLIVMYPFSMFGSKAPDYDHDIEVIPDRNPVTEYIHRVLHIFNPTYEALDKAKELGVKIDYKKYKRYKFLACRHRSWQTHSDLTLLLFILLAYLTFTGRIGLTGTSGAILYLVLTGFILGILAHFLLDMLTRSGIHSFILTGIRNALFKALHKKIPEGFVRIRFVPNTEFFSTGSPYEDFIRDVLDKTTRVYLYGLVAMLIANPILGVLAPDILTRITILLGW